MDHQAIMVVVFSVIVAVMFIADLVFFGRKGHTLSMKEAVWLSIFWTIIALIFNAFVYYLIGPAQAMNFLAAYIVERALSIDNLFVFLIIFSYFSVPNEYQHKVLTFGIIGVLIIRAIFIFAGIALVERLHWLIYILGLFLIVTAVKMVAKKDEDIHPERNPVLRLFRKFFPVTSDYEDGKFFVSRAGKFLATPLFVVVLVIETTDVVFAVDSIPAVFGITLDPFIVYTSNIFAILGLRAMYFVLAGFMRLFHHLHYGLAFVLAFIGVKMLIAGFYEFSVTVALIVITVIITLSIVTSIIWPQKAEKIPGNET